MSIRVIQWVWDHSKAGAADRLVLLAIADNANHDGTDAWPSIEELARKANISTRTVQRCIASLEGLGELVVERNAGGSRATPGNRRPNRYAVIMQGCQSDTPVTDAGVTDEPSGVTSATPRGDTGVTQTVLNRPDPSESVRARDRLPPPHPIPPDWQPTTEHRALCITRQWDLDHEATRFRTHAKATGRKLQDWTAGFDDWLTNHIPNKPATTGSTAADLDTAVRGIELLADGIPCECPGTITAIEGTPTVGECNRCGVTVTAARAAELVSS